MAEHSFQNILKLWLFLPIVILFNSNENYDFSRNMIMAHRQISEVKLQ